MKVYIVVGEIKYEQEDILLTTLDKEFANEVVVSLGLLGVISPYMQFSSSTRGYERVYIIESDLISKADIHE